MVHKRCAVLSFDKDAAIELGNVLVQAGYDRPQHSREVRVASLREYEPQVLVVDFDHLHSDKLESIRQLRFVLPECAIAVVSSNFEDDWARRCHMAGANGVLSSRSAPHRMAAALRCADSTGCYTDPEFSTRHNGN